MHVHYKIHLHYTFNNKTVSVEISSTFKNQYRTTHSYHFIVYSLIKKITDIYNNNIGIVRTTDILLVHVLYGDKASSSAKTSFNEIIHASTNITAESGALDLTE